MSERNPPSASGRLPTPSPNDHLRLLIELMRPCGTELARRWVAALLLVPPEEREALVREVERRVVEAFADRAPEDFGKASELKATPKPKASPTRKRGDVHARQGVGVEV